MPPGFSASQLDVDALTADVDVLRLYAEALERP
jgi:hypothetical protein